MIGLTDNFVKKTDQLREELGKEWQPDDDLRFLEFNQCSAAMASLKIGSL